MEADLGFLSSRSSQDEPRLGRGRSGWVPGPSGEQVAMSLVGPGWGPPWSAAARARGSYRGWRQPLRPLLGSWGRLEVHWARGSGPRLLIFFPAAAGLRAPLTRHPLLHKLFSSFKFPRRGRGLACGPRAHWPGGKGRSQGALPGADGTAAGSAWALAPRWRRHSPTLSCSSGVGSGGIRRWHLC